MSTLLFADFAKYVDGELHSCDLSKNNIENAKHFTKDYSSFTSFYIDDSINFLKSFPKKIDLLYLNSLDGHDSKLASSHQLEEAKMSFNKLHDNSLVLLDDKGAKTLLSLDFYLKNDFKILEESFNQVLLSKRL